MNMDNYAPTTEEVRLKYFMASGRGQETPAEFDRWLAAHDSEVRAGALRDAAGDFGIGRGFDGTVANRLRDRASTMLQNHTKGADRG